MVKFSIYRIEEDEEDEPDLCIYKRRRTSNSQASTSVVDHHQQPSGEDGYERDEKHSTVGPTTNSGGSISVILSDPDVLDCPICFLPLTIPVFQCDSGHIACSSCCLNLDDTCPSCCGKIGNNRCRAIEKVIESVQVSCCYIRYGCTETINYCKKHEHEEKCIYSPCFCPFPDCLYRGPSRSLSTHMSKDHADLVIRFRYNSIFSVFLELYAETVLVLQEERDGILFILNQGNSIAVRCINPSLSSGRFAYDLVLRRGAASLKFQSFTHCFTGQYNVPPSVDYVLIPDYFYDVGDSAKLEICIRNNEASHADIT